MWIGRIPFSGWVSDFTSFHNEARGEDAQDPLQAFRERFSGLHDRLIYLDGNSLGPLPSETEELLHGVVKTEWGRELIRSWNASWFDLPVTLGDLLAPLIGAEPGEVCFADSVTVNLFKLASSALRLDPRRTRIITDCLNFPSDFYALDPIVGDSGDTLKLHKVESPDGMTLEPEAFASAIDERTALVTVSHVVFKSGFMHDLERLCALAHRSGALVLADLSHSVGAVPVYLGKWGVDMAVGCAYKYLNGGPGAPAFLYVRKSLQERLEPVLRGWFGSADPFAFQPEYHAAPGIRRFLVGTPPILSLRAVEPGIRMLLEAGMEAVREKSLRQTRFLIRMHDRFLDPLGFKLGSPQEGRALGSHVSLQHPEAFRISKALIHPCGDQPVVIPDFRKPDNLRLGVAPLYTRFSELARAVERICLIMESREYEQFSTSSEAVT